MRARSLWLILGCGALAGALSGCRAVRGEWGGAGASTLPWDYRHEVRQEPRPLQIHAVRYDLRSRRTELACIVATPDPDGDGPAETRLRHPEITVSNRHLLVAVNTNPFAPVADEAGIKPNAYVHDWPANISGLALEDGVLRSPPDGSGWCFWIDASGRPAIAREAPPPGVRQGVGGFGPVLQAGKVTGRPSGGKSLAPRSAVGFDAARRWLWIVVVDGRQPGVSEGMDMAELGTLLLELGCSEGLNLDGGGSSALFVQTAPGGPVRLVNRPSGLLTRPVPVLLGIRRR
ncbi:MAG: phosphodiester glycosidase family protein [Lentisphaerae bacterium]|nr:phosphodiester glycosidase family protein [Lentisphaerota bacterium]